VGCHWVLPIREEVGSSEDGGGAGADSTAFDAGSEDTGLTCNTAYHSKAACNRCVNESCCEAFDRCFRINLQCKALAECMASCFNASCLTKCANDHAAGSSDLQAAEQCASARCTSACDDDDDGGTNGPTPGSLCDASSTSSCNDQRYVCLPPDSPFKGSCRHRCATWADCPTAWSSCCFDPSVSTDICIPTVQAPDAWTCQ
jgi:hypothetical protein